MGWENIDILLMSKIRFALLPKQVITWEEINANDVVVLQLIINNWGLCLTFINIALQYAHSLSVDKLSHR